MTTLGRLSFWLPTDRQAAFAAAYQHLLIPLLQRHGLTDPVPDDRPAVAGICRYLFELKRIAQVQSTARALAKDKDWQSALQRLNNDLAPAAPDPLLPYRLELYRTPAGPGQSLPIGVGRRHNPWYSLGILDGMPSCISALHQDAAGALWLGTGWLKEGGEWGLCRYDGAYLLRLTTADGLVNNRVRAVVQEPDGTLWLATYGGLSRYDGISFESYTSADGLLHDYVWSLLLDRQGQIWAGTLGGLSRWDGQRFHNYAAADGLPVASSENDRALIGVSSLLEDRGGQIWAGTWSGLCRWDGHRFHTYNAADGLGNDWVRCLIEDRQGQIWIGTGVWDSGSGQQEGQQGGLSRWDGYCFHSYTADDGLAKGMVRCLAEDRQGRIWAGVWGGGISCWDGHRFYSYTAAAGLAGDKVFSLLADGDDRIWVGTLGGGLSRYDGAQIVSFGRGDGLPSNGVLTLLEDAQGRLWVGTWEGLARFDGTSFAPLETLAGTIVQALAPGSQGRLWVATNGDGVLCVDGDTAHHLPQPDDQRHDDVRDVLEDRRGHLWLATNRGLRRYDGQKWTAITTAEGLAHDEVRRLLETRQGHVWAATDGGASVWDGHSLTSFTDEDGLAHNCVLALLEDRQGILWLGTDGGGVSRFDGKAFKTFSRADGLGHDQVNSIFEDGHGHLWLATNGGLCRYNGQVFQRLSRQDGLAHDTVYQVLEDDSQALWIATEGGLTHYRPQQRPPKLTLTDISADRRYGAVQRLSLPVSQHLLRFEFEGRSLTTHFQSMAYICRLEGHERDWRTVYHGQLEYQDLPLGEYVFQVRAVDRDLNYSATATVQLAIEPDPRLEGFKQTLSSSVGEFVGVSQALVQMQQKLAEVAPYDVTALILGETGTGKGLAARILHGLSPRAAGPFIAVNCGALPESLVESEFFGHEKGAFTGAHARKLGKVELAEGGTLFLDEIGDLSTPAQVKLLHLLEEGTFERVGGVESIDADMRVIAATNRDLKQMVAEGTFRQDLYFRLEHFPIRLPPLRQRREDIELLALYFMEKMAAHLHKEVSYLSPETLAQLQSHDWPGNVRELEHVVERAVIVCRGPVIQAQDLGIEGELSEQPLSGPLTPEAYEKQYLRAALERCNGVIRGPHGAAAHLGIPATTLRRRLKKLGLLPDRATS